MASIVVVYLHAESALASSYYLGMLVSCSDMAVPRCPEAGFVIGGGSCWYYIRERPGLVDLGSNI